MADKTVTWEIDRETYEMLRALTGAVLTGYESDSSEAQNAHAVRSVLDALVDRGKEFE